MNRTMMLIAAAVWACPAAAWGFCGAYVGAEGEEIKNQASRIVIAREGTLTTLTMFNDFEGDADQFGLIIPVPASIDQDNVRLVEPALLDRLDRYSAPRLVEYTCEDFFNDDGVTIDPMVLSPSTQSRIRSQRSVGEPDEAVGLDTADADMGTTSGSGGCGGVSSPTWLSDVDTSDDRLDTGYDVVIEDEFNLGEYDLWVLRAEDAEGLSGWLGDNGFVLPAATADALDGYLAESTRFLALRVNTERMAPQQTWLSPLQLRYFSDAWSLPIRLGTVSSKGIQDLIVYALTTYGDGRVAISNYPEQQPPLDECMLTLDPDDVLADFSAQFEEKWSAAAGIREDQ
ncbi:MAG: DUF2330 domain-containing protein, partial [Myxococcota bacterium]